MNESFPRDTYVYSLALGGATISGSMSQNMVRPEVADGGTAFDKGSSCEYIE
jgi:hypothetical protein